MRHYASKYSYRFQIKFPVHLFLFYNFLDIEGNRTFSGAINKITFTSPSFPLLTQSNEINENMFCDEYNLPVACKEHPGELCPCIHRFKVQTGDILQLTIVDETKGANRISFN